MAYLSHYITDSLAHYGYMCLKYEHICVPRTVTPISVSFKGTSNYAQYDLQAKYPFLYCST